MSPGIRHAPRALSHEPRFLDEFIGLPREAQKKVARVVKELQSNPGYHSTPLQGEDGIWRREVAPYRVFFALGDSWVHVYSVRHRQGAYAGALVQPSALPSSASETFATYADEVFDDDSETPEPSPTVEGEEADVTEEMMRQAWACKSNEELLALIDMGLPEWLFDEVAAQLASDSGTAKRPPGRITQVSLIRSRVIESFFGAFLKQSPKAQIVELVIVSPWITSWKGKGSTFPALVSRVAQRRIPMTLITRPPEQPAHIAAVEALRAVPNAEVIELPGLHAKYFICDMAPVPFAMLGSANATAGSISNYEVGVLVRGSGPAESFVRELQSLTNDLRVVGTRVKRRGK